MVADRLENFGLYESLNPGFKAAGEFLKEYFASPKENGGYELGNGVKANVSTYETKPVEGRLYEAHREFIDIQCVVNGAERIGYALTDSLEVKEPFKEGGDIAFFDGNCFAWHDLWSKDFLILWPQDAHLPCAPVDEVAEVTKIVIKVPV